MNFANLSDCKFYSAHYPAAGHRYPWLRYNLKFATWFNVHGLFAGGRLVVQEAGSGKQVLVYRLVRTRNEVASQHTFSDILPGVRVAKYTYANCTKCSTAD